MGSNAHDLLSKKAIHPNRPSRRASGFVRIPKMSQMMGRLV